MKNEKYFGLIYLLLTPIEYHFPFSKLGSWARNKMQNIEIKKFKRRKI
jgi:hypothetical protein